MDFTSDASRKRFVHSYNNCTVEVRRGVLVKLAVDVSNGPTEIAWCEHFFGGVPANCLGEFASMAPGLRPDTVVVRNLPCRCAHGYIHIPILRAHGDMRSRMRTYGDMYIRMRRAWRYAYSNTLRAWLYAFPCVRAWRYAYPYTARAWRYAFPYAVLFISKYAARMAICVPVCGLTHISVCDPAAG